MIFNLLALVVAFPLAALAAPAEPMVLPRGVKKVAFDEVNKRLLAFDHQGRELGWYSMSAAMHKRQTGTCTPMTNDDIDKIPGIQTLRDEADKEFSDGKRNEVVNDKDFPENPANVCADDAGTLIVYDGTPECKNVTNDAGGKLEGGTITLENNEGVNLKSTTQVTKSSSFGVGTKISAGFKFPEIADVSTEISTTSDFTNTQGQTNEVGSDQRTLQRITQPVDEGQDCKVELQTTTCSVNGKGSLKMIAQGFLWFEFEDKVDGHFKWALVMETILPNADDRSSTVEFKTTGTIDSTSTFSSNGCTEGVTKGSA